MRKTKIVIDDKEVKQNLINPPSIVYPNDIDAANVIVLQIITLTKKLMIGINENFKLLCIINVSKMAISNCPAKHIR